MSIRFLEPEPVRFSELSRQASAVGTYKKPRLPEQVDKDLAAASALLSQQKELARHFQTIAGGMRNC